MVGESVVSLVLTPSSGELKVASVEVAVDVPLVVVEADMSVRIIIIMDFIRITAVLWVIYVDYEVIGRNTHMHS